MDISTLSRKLRHYGSTLKISQPTMTEIYAVADFNSSMGNYDPGTLYILEASGLTLSGIEKGCTNVLYIARSDNPVPEISALASDVNFIRITAETGMDSLQKEIELLFEEEKKYNHYHSKLYKLLYQDTGLQQIMDMGYEMLGNPLLLEDVGKRIIARTADTVPGNTVNPTNPPKADKKELSDWQESLSSKRPFVFKDADGTPRLVAKVFIENNLIAYLSIISSVKAFESNDMELLELLCKIISLEMQKNKYKYYFKQYSYEYIIHDLIEGRVDDGQPVSRMLEEREMDLKDSLYLLTLSSAHNQTLNNEILKLRYKLEALIDDSKSIAYNDNILLLIGKNTNETLTVDDLEKLRGFFKENAIYGGLSLKFSNIKNIKKYYLQTLNAIELGLHLNKSQYLFLFGDYLFYHMLTICKQQEDLLNFCHPSVLLLMEYDKKNKTDFLQTIYEYIKHKGNHKDTADALHIYHSTLVYRMKKIKEIIRSELDNDYIFQLELSFKILEYLNKLYFLH